MSEGGEEVEARGPKHLGPRGQDQFLEERRRMSEGGEELEARGPKHLGPRGQIPWPCGTPCFGPRGSVAIDPSSRSFVLTSNRL